VEHLPDSRAGYESLRMKWEELEKLDFPESPGEPALVYLYLELADYTVYVSKIAASILDEGQNPDKKLVRIDEDWNHRMERFNPANDVEKRVCSSLKEYKQVLDEILGLVLKI
jgi:hypothetical protein